MIEIPETRTIADVWEGDWMRVSVLTVFVIIVSLLSFRSLLNLIPERALAHKRLSASKSGRIKRIATKRMLATADALRLEGKYDRAEKILADVWMRQMIRSVK